MSQWPVRARAGVANLLQAMSKHQAVLAGILALALGMAAATSAQAQQAVPPLQALATDQTGTLTAQQLTAIDARLRAFEQRKGSQIALLMVASTQPESIEQYALRVAEQWKLGRKKVDDGVLLLVAKNDRAVRIEVGYGLEGALSDVVTKRIISEAITPRFRAGDFHGGVSAGLDRMTRIIDGEALPAAVVAPGAARTGAGSALDLLDMAPVLLMVVLVGGGVLRAALGRVPGSLLTAGGAGLLVWFVSGALVVAAIGAMLALLVTLLGGGHRGGLGGLGGLHRGGGLGGGFGGGGGGFGGGGYSGGGGGGFGGGGSSGRW